MDRAAAEIFLGLLVIGGAAIAVAKAIDHGGPGGEELAETLHHDRIMAGDGAGGAETGGRAERQCDHRYRV